MLQDGTRMSLNTSTRVRVVFGTSRRTVDVEGGEALFEVAKDASRPFVVRAAGSEVAATGTAFVVRYTPAIECGRDAVAITLVEGRVVVVRGAADGSPCTESVPAVEMVPGQRLRVAGRLHDPDGPVLKSQLDRPHVDQLLAWKRGEAIFDNASLPEAVAEMNRYSTTPIIVVSADMPSDLRISGVFKTGDSASFARAAVKLHDLTFRVLPDRVVLSTR